MTGNRQFIDGLKPANRFFRVWAEHTIDTTMVITEFCQLLLHGYDRVGRAGIVAGVIGIVAVRAVWIIVIRIIVISIVRKVIPVRYPEKEISIVSEMVSVPEMISVPEMVVMRCKPASAI